MKIAIIGSGIFGCSVAIALSKKNKVDLYEIKNDILQGASLANQQRLHSGYHYPRSINTVKNIKIAKKSFVKFFGNKLSTKTYNFYAIAKTKSKTSYQNYIKFLIKNNLPFRIIKNSFISNQVSNLIRVDEKNINYFNLKKFLKKKILENKNINLFLNKTLSSKKINNYKKIIIVTYANNNNLLKKFNIKKIKKFRYELIEKIIIQLPKRYHNKSYIILDGKFVCVDPYLGTKYHLLSDVKNSKIEILKSNYFPRFSSKKKQFVNKGIIKNIKISNFNKFIKYSKKYLPFLEKSKYIGSYYTIRTVQINKESSDERLTEIYNYEKKFMTILSGKWVDCVRVANLIKEKIDA